MVSVPPAPLKVYVPEPVFATKVTVSSPPPPLMVSAPANAWSSAFSVTLFVPPPRFSVRVVTVSANVITCVSPPPLKSIENVLSPAVPLSAMTIVALTGASMVTSVVPVTVTGSMPEYLMTSLPRAIVPDWGPVMVDVRGLPLAAISTVSNPPLPPSTMPSREPAASKTNVSSLPVPPSRFSTPVKATLPTVPEPGRSVST